MALQNTRIESVIDFNANKMLQNKLPNCKDDNNFSWRQGRTDFDLVLKTVNGCEEVVLDPKTTKIYLYTLSDVYEIPEKNIKISGSIITIKGCEELTFSKGANKIIVQTDKGCSWDLTYTVEATPGYTSDIIPAPKAKDFAKVDLSNVSNDIFETKGSSSGLALKSELPDMRKYSTTTEVDAKLDEKQDLPESGKMLSVLTFPDIGFKDDAIVGMSNDEVQAYMLGLFRKKKCYLNKVDDTIVQSKYPNFTAYIVNLTGDSSANYRVFYDLAKDEYSPSKAHFRRDSKHSTTEYIYEFQNWETNALRPSDVAFGKILSNGKEVATVNKLIGPQIQTLEAIIEDDEANGLIVTKKRELLGKLKKQIR